MSKRIGYYPNADLSALNISDSEINSSGLFEGCKIVLYASPSSSSLSTVALDASDPTSPRLIKEDLNEDKKDKYIFNVIQSKSGNGYILQTSSGGRYITGTPQATVIGTKDVSGVWRFIHVGGKSNITCKIQLVTTDNKMAVLAERGDYINITQTEDGSNTEWNIGFVDFGPKAFKALLPKNKFLQTRCCKGTVSTALKSICGSGKIYTPGSSACKAISGPIPYFDIFDSSERSLNVTDDSLGTTEILLGLGIILLIGISIYIVTRTK
jgi:hypothetical protein